MTLADERIDIEIDGREMTNRIIEPTSFLENRPGIRVHLSREVFDHLLERVRSDKDVRFPFKASATGLSIETEAKIEVLGFAPCDEGYYAALVLL